MSSSTVKKAYILSPIKETIINKCIIIYGHSVKQTSLEGKILEELEVFKEKFSIQEILLFANLYRRLDCDLSSKEQKLWREFVYIHMTYLFGKKILKFDTWLLCFTGDAVTKENIGNIEYLKILSDMKMMKKIYGHALMIDFSSSLTSRYRIEEERIKKIFLFLCRKVERLTKELENEPDLERKKKKILKQIKSYQIETVIKRSTIR